MVFMLSLVSSFPGSSFFIVHVPHKPSVDKVDAEEMQDQTAKHKVGKRPLIAEALAEFFAVRGVGLYAERGREDELTDARREAGQERIEGL